MFKIKILLMMMSVFCTYAQENRQESIDLKATNRDRRQELISKLLVYSLTEEEAKELDNYFKNDQDAYLRVQTAGRSLFVKKLRELINAEVEVN